MTELGVVVKTGATWRRLDGQALKPTSPADPTGFSVLGFDDSAWPTAVGAFRSPTGTITYPTLGEVVYATWASPSSEAYYRASFQCHAGPARIDTFVDNWIWVWVDGVLQHQAFFDSGGESGKSLTLTAGTHEIAVRSRSTGDSSAGTHAMALRVKAQVSPWTVGFIPWDGDTDDVW